MRSIFFERNGLLGLSVSMLIAAAACNQSNAQSPNSEAQASASADGALCQIPLPDGIPVPENLTIETCQQSGSMTTFRGGVQTRDGVDIVFSNLKATYHGAGFTVFDNTSGAVRSIIFGGSGHRKGEIQLNPKQSAIAVSINLYPEDME